MKKFIFIVILFAFFNKNVDASEWSDWSISKPDSEIYEVESEVRYRWYNEVKNEDYVLDVENDCEYFDLNDSIKTDWILSFSLPEFKPNRVIKTKLMEVDVDSEYLSFVYFDSLEIDGDMNITEMEIYDINSGDEISISGNYYDMHGEDFVEPYDNNIYDVAFTYMNYRCFLIELDNFYKASDLELKIYYLDEGLNINRFNFTTGHHNTFGNNTNNYYKEKFDVSCDGKLCVLSINLGGGLEDSYDLPEYSVYQYQDILYKCINYDKEYIDGYYTNVNGYVKDEDDYVTYYRYKNKIIDTVSSEVSVKYIYPEVKDLGNNENIYEDANEEKCLCDVVVNEDNIADNYICDKKIEHYIIYLLSFVNVCLLMLLFVKVSRAK